MKREFMHMADYDEFSGETPNFRTVAATKIAEMFPNLVEDGHIDFDALKEELSPDLSMDGGTEKYEFIWRGKKDAKRIADAPARTTSLKFNEAKSLDSNFTSNAYVEGDNLEVLKLLQKGYEGRAKLVYLDPPYNTGSDFVYKDNFHDTYENYLIQTGQVDSEGNALTANKETSGRFHTDWLNMMYPRLKQARNLLTEDGVIMVSIGNKEQANLAKLMDEIFGEANKVVTFMVNSAEGGGQAKYVINGNEFLLVYAKNINKFDNLKRPKDIRGQIVDIDGEQYWIQEDSIRKVFGEYGNLHYEEILEYRDQAFKDEIDAGIANNEYRLVEKDNGMHIIGKLRKVSEDFSKFNSVVKYLTAQGKKDARVDFGFDEDDKVNYFDNPKPLQLLKDMIQAVTFGTTGDLIIDIFSGSSTTARAVQELNVEDGGKRKFVMIQLPENLDENLKTASTVEAKKTIESAIAYLDEQGLEHTLPNVAQERLRHGAAKLKASQSDAPIDLGFRVFELTGTTLRQWDETPEKFEEQLGLFNESSFEPGTSNDDRALELAIKSGITLDYTLTVGNNIYHFYTSTKEVFVVMGDYDTNLISKLEVDRKLNVANVVVNEIQGGSEIKFNLLQVLKQDSNLNNHFNVEWV